jgi:hypothetical protein
MKKKVLFGAAACMIAALSVVGLNTNKTNSSDITLNDMVMTSDANAESSCGGQVLEYSPDGHCVFGYNFCIFSCGVRECDPYTQYY